MNMFWADQIAEEIKKRGKTLEWVDDMKTPSGRVHVGALRGVVIHDLIYKCLKDQGVNSKYTYVFDDHDPMDGLPVYLDQEKYQQYMGMPLFKVPSPDPEYANYAEYFAVEFRQVFNAIGCEPEIIWASKDLYMSGKMNDVIKECLDNADKIKSIYEKIYKKTIEGKMYPFQPFCENCRKVSTTTVTDWDGEKVTYTCVVDKVKFTKGCGYNGKMFPFSTKDYIPGKLPWKIEWPSVWKVLGITVEGAGKDHMTAGGSHDIAKHICEEVLQYPTPFPLAYEWFILGKQKMSSSKGIGASAKDMLTILPPVLLRFLMVRTRINSEINFDLQNPQMIPSLFDEYQKAAEAYVNLESRIKNQELGKDSGQARMTGSEDNLIDLARMFELSQIGDVQVPPKVRFSVLAQWIQMPNMQATIEKEGLTQWVPYAKYWLEHYAPESEKFFIQKELPENAKNLTDKQKEFLQGVVQLLDKNFDAEKLQFEVYELSKSLEIKSSDAFAAIYQTLIGKTHGPKAAWLILSQERQFIKKRFEEATHASQNQELRIKNHEEKLNESSSHLTKTIGREIFSIDPKLAKAFSSISVGIAVIKGVTIVEKNEELEKEKEKVFKSLEGLTTEQLGKYPEVVSYRNLYKEMGIDWHSRRPSPEALLRRFALGKGLYTINTCVDAYNLVVMKHRVSVGAFDLDTINFPTVLRFAKSSDEILLLGDNEPTKYTEKEIAYFDEQGGFNMDFNYRDAKRTAVQLSTKNLYINVDGVYNVTPEEVERSLREACDMIVRYCGGTIETFGVVKAYKFMTREQAYTLLTRYMQSPNLIKHSLAAEAAMRGLYKHLHVSDYDSSTEELWGITGLLHDIDYEVAQKEEKLDLHGRLLFDRDPNLVPEPMQYAIKAHNYTKTGADPKTDMDWAIATVDQLTGLIVSSTLIHPDKKLASIDVPFVTKKFNTSGFSRGVDRENIKLCETKLGIPLDEFIKITLTAMQGIHEELGF